jgi:putative aminophosphonate oxidoreductase
MGHDQAPVTDTTAPLTDAPPRHRSMWLRDALAEEDGGADCPPLTGRQSADVVIVGGGYTGLWTAIELRDREPGLDIAVVEADICGGGASGRNGGFLLSWWPKLETLIEKFGEHEGLRLAWASDEAVKEIGAFCDGNGIDAHYVHEGWLWVATSRAQVGAWEGAVRTCEQHGIDAFRRLSDDEIGARTGSPVTLAGVLEPNAATVQPALLARGMRRVALSRGIRIYEGSPMVALERRPPATVRTPEGEITGNSIVIATNAWAVGIRELRRVVVPLGSDIAATAPMPERLEEVGWTGGEAISDSHLMVNYYRTTRDGRIAWGKGGGRLAPAGRMARLELDRGQTAEAARRMRSIYPMIADVPVEHEWSGWVDRSVTGLPVFGRLPGAPHIVYGIGFSGNGVGPTRVGGRILASLARDRDDEWSSCGLVADRHLKFPPEPARYLGSLLVRSAVARKERAEDEGRRPDPVSARLAGFAPSGYFKISKQPEG